MGFRFLDLKEFDPAFNMALDEVLGERVASGDSEPVIRFYNWRPRGVSFGYFQRLEDAVNLEKCEELRVPFVRRLTGGASVLHDVGDFTYSVILPEDEVSKGVRESYEQVCSNLIKGFEGLGLNAVIDKSNDLLVDGRKVSGNAQVRRNGFFLQHGTVIMNFNAELNLELIAKGEASESRVKGLRERVVGLNELGNWSLKEVCKAFRDAFFELNDVRESELTGEELRVAEKLSLEKYSSIDWSKGKGVEDLRGPCYF